MEIWAHCGTCTRWFYCPRGSELAAAAPRCPVCGAAPEAVERRRPSGEREDLTRLLRASDERLAPPAAAS